MATKKKANIIIKKIKKTINSSDFMLRNRFSEKDFTRKRKLPFVSLMLFYLNFIKKSLQNELTEFAILFSKGCSITKSAFCQQRLKLKPESFIELNEVLVREFYTDNIIKKWNNFRLLAIDGSKAELPRSKEVLSFFGHDNKPLKIPMTLMSTIYDLLNNIIIDSQIAPYSGDERTLAIKFLDHAKKGDLIICDRGYKCTWLFFCMHQRKINYVMRISAKKFIRPAQEFYKSDKMSEVIELKECSEESKKRLDNLGIQFQPFKLRFVKVLLETGEIELLATSLIDEKKYPTECFKELYFKRWSIEENYKHLKNHIELHNFTGKSSTVIKQDFYANIFLANLQSIIMRDAQDELKKTNTEYEYKINRNLSLSYMKNRVIKILTSDNPAYLEELKQLFKIEPIPIRPDRKNPRKKIYTRRYRINQKRAL